MATRNAGKMQEIRALLAELPFTLLSLDDVNELGPIDEDQATLAANARKKAVTLFVKTGLTSLADDTGLEVRALGGRPGVHSARYAGPEADDAKNRQKLLDALNESDDRSARFRTVIALVRNQHLTYFEGVCAGRIAMEERGTGGFGYDSVFEPAGAERTFSEMPAEEKNAISHRAEALRKVKAFLALGG